jgi:hypothetical protein
MTALDQVDDADRKAYVAADVARSLRPRRRNIRSQDGKRSSTTSATFLGPSAPT